MNNFKNAFENKLIKSRFNNYGIDNYDEYRFGKFPDDEWSRLSTSRKIKNLIKKIIPYKQRKFLKSQVEFLNKYEAGLQRIYEQLDTDGKKLLTDIIAYRRLGYKMVKLPRNNKEYWDTLEIAKSCEDRNDTYDPHFLHFILQKCDLRKIGYDINIYLSGPGIAIDFIFEQYAYKSGDKTIVSAENGDIVLDLGACWGDTALYFAYKTGESGKVYSFEFIPDNIKLFNLNMSLNPKLIERVELIKHPVSQKSGDNIYFMDNGPGSKIKFEPFDGQTGFTSTISIDDFIRQNKINKVDFIKMDIEGAEPLALEGAIETIKKFKPKLAIAIYHSIDDFVNIPNWILDLNLGYKIYLGHNTIHFEETVIFAKIEK